MTDLATTTIDHWWWRPGWRIGRSCYTWHVTFNDSPKVRSLATTFAPALASLPTWDPVTAAGLHITVQGLGFTDEVDFADIARIVEAAQTLCASSELLQLELGPVDVDAEALGLPVANPAGLAAVRRLLQQAIGRVWGEDRIPERTNLFRPHLSLGYSNGVVPIADVRAVLTAAALDTLTLTETVDRLTLIDLNRDNKSYEWQDVATVKLGLD